MMVRVMVPGFIELSHLRATEPPVYIFSKPPVIFAMVDKAPRILFTA